MLRNGVFAAFLRRRYSDFALFRLSVRRSSFDGSSKFTPPRKFMQYMNHLCNESKNGYRNSEETAAFLLHCPYLALRWNFVDAFVQFLDCWLADIAKPFRLKSLTSPDSVPYVLCSLVRLHKRWSSLATKQFVCDSATSAIAHPVETPVSPWTKAIHTKEFSRLLDRLVDIGFHRCDIVDVAAACNALVYFSRHTPAKEGDTPIHDHGSIWPSKLWLTEFMTWIIRWLKSTARETYCDASVGPVLLATVRQFGDALPSGRYQLLLKILAELSKEKFRDFVAERRNCKAGVLNRKGALCSMLPPPHVFLHYSSSWLDWDINPDDPEFAPGSWRVWYEALHYAGHDYAVIGARAGKMRNSFVVERAPVFARLLVDMVTVARLFGRETIFANTGAKGTWETWATLTAFCCKPAVIAWLLEEMQMVENTYLMDKGLDALLPKEFIRPALRNHLTYLASRASAEKLT